MKLVLLVPNLIRDFIANFPQTSRNAYGYFNYDNRVVDERVDRGDHQANYQGPDKFSNEEYGSLVVYAKSQVNPILAKYSKTVAAEDAMNMAIGSYMDGKFAAKINANKFAVLVEALKQGMDPIIVVGAAKDKPAEKPAEKPAKKQVRERKQEGPKNLELSRKILKDIGVKPFDVPRIKHKAPILVRKDKGQIELKQ